MQGYLTKPNKNFGSKKRFFVLDRMTLSYYENEAKGQKLADIVLNAQTRVSAVGAQQINIDNVQVSAKSSAKTSYALLCDSPPPQRDQWIAALTHACGIEEAERLKAQREAEERARLEAEEAERRRRDAEEAERRRREAEEAERRRRDAEEAERRRLEAEEEAERLRLLALQQAVVEDIPEPALDLKPRVETSQAVYKVYDPENPVSNMAAWLQELSGLPVAASNEAELQAQLKNGVVLCQAANRMGAGISTISKSDKMFEQISNIGKFLEFLKTTGVADRDVFVTTDLYDIKDMKQVMIGLNSLGRALHKMPGYSGPTVCRAEVQRRSSTFTVQDNVVGPGMRPLSKRGSIVTAYDSMGERSPSGGLRPGSGSFAPRSPSIDERTANADANSELARNAAAEAANSSVFVKVYDPENPVSNMAAWLQELSGLPVAASNEAELQAQLKNGVVLCQAANRMGAGISTISKSDKMFEQISNIGKFLEFLKTTGVADRDAFVTTDLYDNKDMRQVMIGLNSLGRALHKMPGYSGPSVARPAATRRSSTFSTVSADYKK
jgi:hypothetical protein